MLQSRIQENNNPNPPHPTPPPSPLIRGVKAEYNSLDIYVFLSSGEEEVNLMSHSLENNEIGDINTNCMIKEPLEIAYD